MKKFLSVFFVFMLGLSLVACGGKKNSIIGKWQPVDADEEYKIYYEFQENNKLVMSMSDISVQGTYNLDGDKIKMTVTVGEEKQELGNGTYKVDGDKLTITIDGEAEEFTRVK